MPLALASRMHCSSHHRHSPTGCAHDLASAPQPVHTTVVPTRKGHLYGIPSMGQTPIYDQLRGERINADVPALVAVPEIVDRPGKHHQLAIAPGAPAMFGPGPSMAVHARPAPAHAASNSPALSALSAASHEAAAGDQGGHRGTDAQFPWFNDDHEAGRSS